MTNIIAITHMYTGLQVKSQLFLSDSNQTRDASTYFIKNLKHKNISGGNHSVQCGQTDMGRLVIIAFRKSFANAPKIENEGPNWKLVTEK